MSFDRERARLADIVEYSNAAINYLEDRSLDALAADPKSIAAIERCLQCVTEAAIRIGEDRMAIIAPHIPLHILRGLGNRLRHSYDDIELATIYRTIVEDLPKLCAASSAALDRK